MRLLTYLTFFALFGLLVAALSSTDDNDDDDKVVITYKFFLDEYIKYTSEHDIVKVVVPLNSLNIAETAKYEPNFILFFIEADIKTDGTKDYKGLYVLKDGKAKVILEKGRDAAASCDDSKLVFLAADDGIYVYNNMTNSAEKYGSMTDSIIAIEKEIEGDVIYILTADHEVYKVSNNGQDKEKLDDIENAQAIMLDHSNTLYFYSNDKKPRYRTPNGIKDVTGLPEVITDAQFVKPIINLVDGLIFIVGTEVYALSDGQGKVTPFELKFKPKAMPTAFAPEATLVQYYAYHKKIYEFNLLKMLEDAPKEIHDYLVSKEAVIRTMSAETQEQAVKKRLKSKPEMLKRTLTKGKIDDTRSELL